MHFVRKRTNVGREGRVDDQLGTS